jgi:hypothetical protein
MNRKGAKVATEKEFTAESAEFAEEKNTLATLRPRSTEQRAMSPSCRPSTGQSGSFKRPPRLCVLLSSSLQASTTFPEALIKFGKEQLCDKFGKEQLCDSPPE